MAWPATPQLHTPLAHHPKAAVLFLLVVLVTPLTFITRSRPQQRSILTDPPADQHHLTSLDLKGQDDDSDPYEMDSDLARYYQTVIGMKLHHNIAAGTFLTKLFRWEHALSLRQLRKAQSYIGSNSRLRRVVHDLLVGDSTIKIGVLGTSISFGTGVSKPGVSDWFSLLGAWLKEAFPRASIQMRNGCMPATPSSFAAMCFSQLADPDVDLLFLEFVTNDYAEDVIFDNLRVKEYERLVRHSLKSHNNPAVVHLQTMSFGQAVAEDTPDSPKSRFHETTEDVYSAVVHYYDTPALSLRDALWIEAEYETGDITFEEFLAEDRIHPNDWGHRFLADMVIWAIQQTAIDLMLLPYGASDQALVAAPVPPPMHKGNFEPRVEVCLHGQQLQQVVQEQGTSGWTLLNEGTEVKPKYGYISQLPGSSLSLHLDTQAAGAGVVLDPALEKGHMVYVMLSYLKSYEHMGMARVSCVANCMCTPLDLNGHHNIKASTTFMALVPTTTHKDCQISIKVLANTTSGKHKFKVTGVMMHSVLNLDIGWDQTEGEFRAVDLFAGDLGLKP